MNLLKKITGSNLRNKVLIYFILLASIPALAVGLVTLLLINSSHRIDISRLEIQLIDQKIEEIEKFIADTSGLLDLRVGIDQPGLSIAPQEQDFLLRGLLDTQEAFDEVSFVRLDGVETAKLSRYGINHTLLNVSRLEYFKKASEGELYIGTVNHTLDGPKAMFAAPVRNSLGDIIQVLVAYVDFSDVVINIDGAILGNEGWLILFDSDGRLITSGVQSNVAPGTNLSSFSRLSDIFAGVQRDALAPDDRYNSLLNNEPVVGAGKVISGLGWAILAEWPISDADAIILAVRQQILLLTLSAIIAVVVIAGFFASGLIRPISLLKNATSEVEQGNFDSKINVKTGDELEELAESFNSMSQGLKRLQELKSEFVFIAAHELRAPVTAIKGYLSMAYEDKGKLVSPKLKQFLDPVVTANERLVRLVANILEIARSEAGKVTIEVSPIGLGEPIQSIAKEAIPLAKEKSVELIYEPLAEPVSVMADSDKVKEVLMNLVSNAIKYSKKDGGKVRIYHEMKNGQAVVHVEDNGIGISDQDQKQMFSKFFRTEEGVKSGAEGTGLGLFIIKELMEKMNGKIWLTSKIGVGSTFSFSLPISSGKNRNSEVT